METNNTLARQFIKSVANDLAGLNGDEFENFCHHFLGLIVKEPLLHKGCNLNGKPVGYAVDIKSENCAIVGQSGTDIDYFSNPRLEKPIADINGTIRNNKLCEELYLLTNQVDSDREHTALVTKINTIGPHFDVEIYDGQRIAETIYHKINNPKLADLWQYLGNSHNFYAILPKKNCIPQKTVNYVYRRENLKEVQKILSKQDIVQIIGISGIGKSEFAKQVSQDISQDYESVIWIDGKDFNDSIESIQISQFNYDINLKFVIGNYKALVVVDNLNENVRRFVELFMSNNKSQSKCIITSLEKDVVDEECYPLPFMTNEQISNVIDNSGLNFPKEKKEALIALVAGYPLALDIICSLVKNGEMDLDDLLSDDALRMIEDDRHQKLTNRIIAKIYAKYQSVLDILGFIDSLVLSKSLLESLTNKIQLSYIYKYSIIQSNDAYTARIHQIVLLAIKSISQEPDTNALTQKLTSYIESECNNKDIIFFVSFHFNEEFIEKIYYLGTTSEDQKKIILYASLQYHDTFKDKSHYIKLIDQYHLDPIRNLYDCLLLLEKYEIELSTYKDENDRKRISIERIKYLRSISNQTTDENIKFELCHHIGKIYAKISDNNNAEKFFHKALTFRKDYPATLLQLAKVEHFKESPNIDEVKRIITTLFESQKKENSIPLTILLACYSTFLSKYQYRDLAERYIENDWVTFEDTIITSLYSFDQQAITTLGKLANKLSYMAPKLLKEAFSIVSEPPAANSSRATLEAYAQLNALKFKIADDKKTDDSQRAYNLSKEYFIYLIQEGGDSRKVTDYIRKRYMELLMDGGDLEEAKKIANSFVNKDNEFYLQDAAKLCDLCGDSIGAISNIDKAIRKTNSEAYKSAFLSNKAMFLHKTKDFSCIEVLKQAAELRKDDKTKKEWLKLIAEWEKEKENA